MGSGLGAEDANFARKARGLPPFVRFRRFFRTEKESMVQMTQDYLRIVRERGAAPAHHAPTRDEPTDAASPFAAYARSFGTVVRFTVVETEDVIGDIAFLARIRGVLFEHPGENAIRMRIVTLDGRRPVVEWRALASSELRMSLARLLATRAPGAL